MPVIIFCVAVLLVIIVASIVIPFVGFIILLIIGAASGKSDVSSLLSVAQTFFV